MLATTSQSNAASKRHDIETPERCPVCLTHEVRAISVIESAQTLKLGSASFSSLPFELREQIWLYTLPPRLIYLHLHEVYQLATDDLKLRVGHDSPNLDYVPRTASVIFNHSIYSQGTTPAEAFALYAKETIASLEIKRKLHLESTSDIWDLNDFKFEIPAPPAALVVCRESRQIAIRKGYVIAFRPVNLKTKGNKTEEKGIWVDFEHDIIMFNTIPRHESTHPRTELYDLLRLLMEVVPEDVARIRNLALRGDLISVLETLRACGESVINGGDSEWHRFSGYRNLKHILVDDEFNSHERYRSQSPTRTPSPLFRGNEQAVEEFLKARLIRNDMYANPSVWPWGIPSFKVVRGEAWKEYF